MRRLIHYFIIPALATALFSCGFQKPLLTFNEKAYEKVDMLTGTTLKIESYKYPRVSWLGGPHLTGLYVSNTVYDKNDKLTTKIFSRHSNSAISDGNLKIKTKILYYSDSLKVIKIEYLIDKFHGPGRMPILRRTMIWDNEGKKYIEDKPAMHGFSGSTK